MTHEQIEGNKIIAVFDGKKFIPYNDNSSYEIQFNTYSECEKWIGGKLKDDGYKPELGWGLGMGKYNSSWDWLMPVVEKINVINDKEFDVIIFRRDCHINDKYEIIFEKSVGINAKTLIEAVWLAVVEFIEWYNSLPDRQATK